MSTAALTPQAHRVIDQLNNKIASAKGVIDLFKAKLEEEPAYAFELSRSAFEAAAVIAIYSGFVASLTSGDESATIKSLFSSAERLAKQGALFPSMSSSPTTNLMETYKTKVYAEMAEQLSYCIDR